MKCTWLLPAYVNEVPYSKVKDINLKSPSSESCSNSNHKEVAKAEMLGYLSVEEMNSLFAKVTKINRRLLSSV